jgi:NTP pyrophosphatase (non-canonical NTP hydrolase)
MKTQISEKAVALIQSRIEARNEKGFETYGETLDDVPFENYNWNSMMNEELLDALQYAMKEITRLEQELKEKEDKVDVKVFENDVWRTFNKNIKGQDRITNAIFGLNGEAGEVADIFKKVWYQGHLLNPDEVKDELGDVIYYVSLLANIMDSTLDEIMTLNMIKRAKRYPLGFDVARSVNRNE